MIQRLPTALAALAFTLATLAAPAVAQDRRPPASVPELKLSFAPVVQRVAPAVVNIFAAKVVENRHPLMDDPFFRRFFGGPGGLPREQVQRSLGSGVLVDPAGLVVTNNHVVEGMSEVKAVLADKREFEAEIVLKDARTDLAVLKLKDARDAFPAIELGDSDALQVGDLVLAIGNPFGVGQTVPDEPYEFTATDGPDAFPGVPYALVNGRQLTWCGPSLVAARTELAAAISTPGGLD